MKHTYLIFAISLAMFMISPITSQAQIDEDGFMDIPADGNIDFSGLGDYFNALNQTENAPYPGDESPTGNPGVPVDGGLGFLLAAGLGYGANRLRKNRQQKQKLGNSN